MFRKTTEEDKTTKKVEVECPADFETSSIFGTDDTSPDLLDDDDLSISSISPMMKRSKLIMLSVLLIGLGGGTAFIYFGVKSAQSASDQSFVLRASQLSKDIGATVQEYEIAARSVQDVCRRRDTTRVQFRQFYEYLVSGGLQVQAAQCLPNVSHAERPKFEKSAKEYYDAYYPYPGTNYSGFKGWEYDTETDSYPLRQSRSDAPVYFPVDKCEPVLPNSAALGLDTYSHPFQKNEIDLAISTNQPILGGRLKLVQEEDDNAYTVIMRHPGVRSEPKSEKNMTASTDVEDNSYSRDIGNILIRIPSLLERRGKEQKESIACYLYDITPSRTDGGRIKTYLGAAEYDARLTNGTVITQSRIPPNDMEYEDVIASQPNNRHIFETNITIASNAIWTLVVTPIPGDDSFEPAVATLVFGGGMLILSTIGLALFLWNNMKQVESIHHAKRQAEAERKIIASLYPKNVVERLLSDERAKQEAAKKHAKNKGKKMYEIDSTFDSSRPGGGHQSDDNSGNDMFPIGVGENGGILSVFGTDPIAHQYENTTVIFMDLVGFTAWSRSREPAQVFTLLETIYNEFDTIAKRKRIFKVETVGDCYVAVTGLPDPRKNHAGAMVLFAHECIEKMAALKRHLAPSLGQDTCALDLRVGMSR